MKFRVLFTKIILLSVLFLSISRNSGCKTPEELGYTPDFDSLMPPPPPPILIFPTNDTGFVIQATRINIPFQWSAVEGAEYYRLQHCPDSFFENSMITEVQSTSPSLGVLLACYGRTDVYWRVCAYCREWTWYTDWSAKRYFWIVRRP